jgi:hypothetical protein
LSQSQKRSQPKFPVVCSGIGLKRKPNSLGQSLQSFGHRLVTDSYPPGPVLSLYFFGIGVFSQSQRTGLYIYNNT